MYVDKQTRNKFGTELKNLGHNLIKIIDDLRTIPKYRGDKKILRFLKIIEGVIRMYYYPLYKADQNREWANSRYPKGFYDDSTQEGKTDALREYPDQSMIVKLFDEIDNYIDRIWGLRKGLMKKRNNIT